MTMRILLRDVDRRRWLEFDRPRMVISTSRVGQVVAALREIEAAVQSKGLTAAGFVAYEAAPAFDSALRVGPAANGLPLVCFGLFDPPVIRDRLAFDDLGSFALGEWGSSETAGEYGESIRAIRHCIARGETYQVNHTFRLRASFDGDPRALFRALVRAQPESMAAYLDLGDLVICSASPELFFRLDGNRLTSRPMKGTVERGWNLESDLEREQWLAESEKNRAENAMIVDMVRNDLGRVARVGSVEVTGRFNVERHPTVFQMTSTVTAESDASVTEIFAALFPFASITGAPKVRTVELIGGLETEARGIYTGAIGTMEPGRKARFAVGIRTALVNRAAKNIEYGVGSGVVWDSVAGDEYDECIAKAKIISELAPEFELLETMLWQPDSGFSLLGRHFDRMAGAAEYFCRPFDRNLVAADLRRRAADFGDRPQRVRLLLAADGGHRIESTAIVNSSTPAPVRLGLATTPVEVRNPFLHFKTTHREIYKTALVSRPECDDVLLWNENGEVTESTIANLVVGIDDVLVTPQVKCGLLAGTFRAELIERGEITERIITVDELPKAEALYLINSVQGWRDVEWVD